MTRLDKPSTFERLRIALNVFRHGFPTRRHSPVWKASPYAWPQSGMGSGNNALMSHDLQTLATYGYNINAVIYAAIMYKVRAVAKAPLYAYQGDRSRPELLPDDHWLQRLCRRPNEQQSYMEFQGLNTAYLNLTGNSFVLVDTDVRNNPIGLYPLRPDRVEIVANKEGDEILGYTYSPGGSKANRFPILPGNIIHVKFPNMLDPLEGMGQGYSPVNPGASSADVDNAVSRFLKNLFETGVFNYGVLETDSLLDEATIARLRSEWTEMYGGSDEWGKPIVTDQGLRYRPLLPDFESLGMEALDGRDESRILAPFGVPAALLGLRVGLENATFSNISELRRMFWEDTMTYEIELFEVDYSYHVAERANSGYWVAHDLSQVPALQRNIPELAQAANNLWNMGVPASTALRTVGLETEYDGSEVSYVPTTMIDASIPRPTPGSIVGFNGKSAEPGGTQPDSAIVPVADYGRRFDDKGVWTEDAAYKVWRQQDAIAQKHEPAFRDSARKMLQQDKQEILAFITEGKRASLHAKATISWVTVAGDVLDYLRSKSADDWRDEFIPRAKALVEESGNEWSLELGLAFNVENVYSQQWFEDYAMKFAETTNDTTKQGIKDLFDQAASEGWTVDTGIQHLGQMFQQWMAGDLSSDDFDWLKQRMPVHRLEQIVRTETIRWYGAGTNKLFQDWGVERKVWYTAEDERVCPFCKDMNGKIIKVGKPWFEAGETMTVNNNGKELSLPMNYGTVEHPPLHTFCRCTELPLL